MLMLLVLRGQRGPQRGPTHPIRDRLTIAGAGPPGADCKVPRAGPQLRETGRRVVCHRKKRDLHCQPVTTLRGDGKRSA
jgi:hypothetical protein